MATTSMLPILIVNRSSGSGIVVAGRREAASPEASKHRPWLPDAGCSAFGLAPE